MKTQSLPTESTETRPSKTSKVLYPIPVVDRHLPFVKIQRDTSRGGTLYKKNVSSAQANCEEQGLHERDPLPEYTDDLMSLLDRDATTSTTASSTVLSSSDDFSSDLEESLLSSFSDSKDAYDVHARAGFNSPTREKNSTQTEKINVEEKVEGSPVFPKILGHFSNDIKERRYECLSRYGANKIIKKREDELAQYIKNLLKAITFEVHWRMKQQKVARKMSNAERQESRQRLYNSSRSDYRMEGRRRREDIAKKLELRSMQRKYEFRLLRSYQ